VDLSQPDSLTFNTSLNRHQFSILSFGNTVFTAINDPFEFTAYEHDLPVKSFMVGPENPDFRSLDRIPAILPYAVMTSEDGAFYLHRGFLPDAFRESMIQNIKERRFARGGSTISMQLIKNLFLSRNKTIARKIEEALIVWLIENNNLTTKERMMEIYLNIIEWGPMIYGANEASRFYFNKDVSRIGLAEAIFMASIIPRPKSFRYQFDEQGQLRESAKEFFRLVAGKMAGKGWITSGEAEKLIPEVTLKGPARAMLKTGDSIPVWEQ
jgi:membrane peptidoglycan carboxypeptidase